MTISITIAPESLEPSDKYTNLLYLLENTFPAWRESTQFEDGSKEIVIENLDSPQARDLAVEKLREMLTQFDIIPKSLQ